MELTLSGTFIGSYPAEAVRDGRGINKAILIGVILCILQTLDGFLTSLGVVRFGTDIEGNPLLRLLMEHIGHTAALGVVKALSIAVIVVLVLLAKKMPWVTKALGAVSCVYLFSAILPWTYFLFIQPYFM